MKKVIIVFFSVLSALFCFILIFHHYSSSSSSSSVSVKNDTITAKKLNDYAKSIDQYKPDSAIILYHKAIGIISKLPSDYKTTHLQGIFYINLANVYIPQAKYDSTIILVNKALQITQYNNKEVEARCYNLNALVYLQKQEFDSATLYFNRAATIARQIKNKQILARTISGKAIIYCMQGDLKSGLRGFLETMKIGKMINDEEIISGSCINIGMVYMNLSELDSALNYYEKALGYYKKHNLKNDQVLTYNNIGTIYYYLEEYSNAIDLYRKSLNMAIELNDKKGIAKAYHNLGEIYKVIGDYNMAISYNFKAFKIKESISDKAGVAMEYRLLASLYNLQKNKQKTLYYHVQAFKIDSALSLFPMMANDYANMATDLDDMGDKRRMVEYLQKALSLHQQADNYFGMSEIYKVLGETYERDKKYDKALQYYNKSLDIKNQLPSDQEGISRLNISLSKFYNNRSAVNTQNLNALQLSTEYALKSYKIAQGLKDPNLIADASKCLSDAYKAQGNYKKAVEMLEIQKTANDSIFAKSKAEALIFGEARWNSEKKQHQISVLEKLNKVIVAQKAEEAKRHTITVIGLIIIFILVAIVAVIFWMFKHKQRDFRLQQQLSRISILRLQNIRNRISPHFIFNILNREISSEEDKEKHKEMIGLVKFLRRSLEITEQTSVTLAEELDFVKNYLQMEQVSLGNEFSVQWSIDNEIITEQWKIPAMIIQIPVENALKHALRPKQGEKLLKIDIGHEPELIKISICDNGDGYHPENTSTTKGTGTGLKVLRQTIQLLNIKNTKKITFDISDCTSENSTGTKVEIGIPFDYNFDLE